MERLQLKAERGVYVVQGYICTNGLLLCYIVYRKVLLLQALSFSLLKCSFKIT